MAQSTALASFSLQIPALRHNGNHSLDSTSSGPNRNPGKKAVAIGEPHAGRRRHARSADRA
jgi:hypothetical protein